MDTHNSGRHILSVFLFLVPQEQLLSLDRLREEHETQQLALQDLRSQLSHTQEHEAGLEAQLKGASAQLEQLQRERVSLVSEKVRVASEAVELKSQWEEQEKLVTALREQIERSVGALEKSYSI